MFRTSLKVEAGNPETERAGSLARVLREPSEEPSEAPTIRSGRRRRAAELSLLLPADCTFVTVTIRPTGGQTAARVCVC